jgi:hypothetical protein
MGNRALILAGVKGGGTAGAALASFAALGTTLPSAAAASLHANFRDAGWCSEDGLKKAVSESTTVIRAFGSSAPVRKLVTTSETTFELVMLESNPTAIEVYNRKALDSITVDDDGLFDFTEGEPETVQMAAVFDLVDGPNRIRGVVPILEVTDRKEFSIKASEGVTYGVTMTAYPGEDGVAIHWYYSIPALGN